MKTKLLRDRKAGALTLQITPSKHEMLEYGQAEWLKSGAQSGFCTFDYRRDGATTLYYDLTGLVDLNAYLKAAISLSQYRLLLTSLADVMDACTQKCFPTASLLCDPSLVYVDATGAPRFVYVPLSGMTEKSENTPIALLKYLASLKHVTFAVTTDNTHAAALDDFVSRNAVLSLSAYRSFLSSEFGLGLSGSFTQGTTPSKVSGSTGGMNQRTPFGQSTAASPVAFDFVATLRQAPSATEVKASQSVAEQVRNAVGGYSPTAAVPQQVAPATPQQAAPAPVPVPTPVSTPAPIPTPVQNAEEPKHSAGAARGKVVGAGGTTLLGSFSAIRPSQPLSAVPATPRAAWLVRQSDGTRLRLPDDNRSVVVGRSVTCDMQFSGNGNISRRHAELVRTGTQFELKDLGSANGTHVGGRRLAPQECMTIVENETFMLADETFKIVFD